jgi:hypothetical protein
MGHRASEKISHLDQDIALAAVGLKRRVPEKVIGVPRCDVIPQVLLEFRPAVLVDGHMQILAMIEQAFVQEVIHALDEGLFELVPPVFIHPTFADNREIKL